MQGIFHNSFRDKQTPPSSSLKLVEFETSYIERTPPFFFRQQNMQWSCNMVHSHFTLCLRVHDYPKWLSQHPWYGLRMRVKGSHHYKVMALGSCVKWPLGEVEAPMTETLTTLYETIHNFLQEVGKSVTKFVHLSSSNSNIVQLQMINKS